MSATKQLSIHILNTFIYRHVIRSNLHLRRRGGIRLKKAVFPIRFYSMNELLILLFSLPQWQLLKKILSNKGNQAWLLHVFRSRNVNVLGRVMKKMSTI